MPVPNNMQRGGQNHGPTMQNHLGNGPSGPSVHNAAAPNGVTHAGYQMDMNYLWGVVQELSDLLAQNRAQMAGIVGNVHHMQARGRNAGQEEEAGVAQTNGELNGEQSQIRSEAAELQLQLNDSQRRAHGLAQDCDAWQQLVESYEATLESLRTRVRAYAQEHHTAIIATHKHYGDLLEQERENNMQLRIEHGEWQKGLGKATELARQALRARSDETNGLEQALKEVRAENRVLRKLVGWMPREDDVDSEYGDGEGEGSLPADDDGKRMPAGPQLNSASARPQQSRIAISIERGDDIPIR